MKICFIASGNNFFLKGYCEYLVSKKHDVHYIPISIPEKKNNGVTYHNLGSLYKMKLFQIFYYFKIKRYVKKVIKPDIISAFIIWNCGWIGTFTNYHPFVLHIFGSDLFANSQKSIIRKILTSYSIKKADIIISESKVIRNITSKVRKNKKNNYVIQFGVKLDLFKPQLDTNNLRKELGVKDEYVIISPRKSRDLYNPDIVLKAFSFICAKRRDVYLLMKSAGYDDDPVYNKKFQDKLENLAIEYGISDKIRYFGFVPLNKLPYYYNLANIIVSVPSSDSVSVTMQEAMACGVPPIVTDLPALHEWIKDDYNGMIVPIRNAEKLAEKINYLLDNEEKRDAIIKRNLILVKNQSDYYQNMELMEKVYETAINSNNYI